MIEDKLLVWPQEVDQALASFRRVMVIESPPFLAFKEVYLHQFVGEMYDYRGRSPTTALG